MEKTITEKNITLSNLALNHLVEELQILKTGLLIMFKQLVKDY